MMNKQSAKIAFFKSVPFSLAFFTLSIVLFSVESIIDGTLVDPVNILIIFGTFIIIGVLNFFRVYIDKSKWAMSKPSFVKNFIFAPIYLIIAILMVSLVTREVDLALLISVGIIFLIVFMTIQLIVYCRYKKNTDKINDALQDCEIQ